MLGAQKVIRYFYPILYDHTLRKYNPTRNIVQIGKLNKNPFRRKNHDLSNISKISFKRAQWVVNVISSLINVYSASHLETIESGFFKNCHSRFSKYSQCSRTYKVFLKHPVSYLSSFTKHNKSWYAFTYMYLNEVVIIYI